MTDKDKEWLKAHLVALDFMIANEIPLPSYETTLTGFASSSDEFRAIDKRIQKYANRIDDGTSSCIYLKCAGDIVDVSVALYRNRWDGSWGEQQAKLLIPKDATTPQTTQEFRRKFNLDDDA